MSRLDALPLVSDKQAVVIDIGAAYTKCGFASEFYPRAIIPSVYEESETRTKHKLFDPKHSREEQKRILTKFIHNIYYKYLLCVCKDRRVVLVESVLCPSDYRNLLAEVLFEQLDVPSILPAPGHLLNCFPTHTQHAMVVDVGHTETLALPVYSGVCLLNAWESSPLGASAIHSKLRSLLLKDAKLETSTLGTVNVSECPDLLSDKLVEDIKVRTCFVTTQSRGRAIQSAESDQSMRDKLPPPPQDVRYPIEGDKTLVIPGRIRESAAEILFEYDDDQKSIPQLILESILRCPIDIRRTLSERILLVGGSCLMQGFTARLKHELIDLLENKYKDRLPLDSVKFYVFTQPIQNYMAWCGGSMFGALEILPYRSMTKEEFLANNRQLPDWTDKIKNGGVVESDQTNARAR